MFTVYRINTHDIDIVIKINFDYFHFFHTYKTEKEEKEEKEEKLPEEKKLIDNSEDDKESVSNNGNHDESVTKVITDEWTIIDKSDTTEGNQACSISSNVDETANQACSTSTNVDETANQACSTSSNINETEEEKVKHKIIRSNILISKEFL